MGGVTWFLSLAPPKTRGGKAGQPALHWPVPRLASKNAGRVGPPHKVITG